MCRMFGMVATHPTTVRDLLHEAPRSLRVLSQEHADGWGIALRDGDDWLVKKSTTCAARCAAFAELAGRASLVIAHVRKKTVGELAIANTHPFRRGSFVFAHNGTIGAAALAAVERRTAQELAAGVHGSTDSERFFAFVMTHVMEAGDVEAGVVAAVTELHALDGVGSASFLLSCGKRLYAHRMGRTLYVARRACAGAREGACARARPTGDVAIVASEPLTESDAWREIPERGLVVLDGATLEARELAA